jgi:NAD-dependent SIR2 family protein deacetylase
MPMGKVQGRGAGKNRIGMGPSGSCVCVKCGYSAPKQRGVPCMDLKCPSCGAVLLRKGSDHYNEAVDKT